jgi:hypothetical protein
MKFNLAIDLWKTKQQETQMQAIKKLPRKWQLF